MRFQKYLNESDLSESLIWNMVKNFFSKMSRLKSSDMEYHLKTGWYDFVDKIREDDKEKEMVDFINRTFHQRIKSLDDVNLSILKNMVGKYGPA